jgi:hypothetical protein
MVRIDEKVARAMTLLKNPEFAALLTYWKVQYNDTVEEMVTAPDEKRLRQLQGRAGFIKELCQTVENSNQLCDKLKRP